ncbi:MAG: ATP-dependent DNA helicase RecG [Bacilli bacterium]|nr:ATP-dependent DNA helicase RecG [Bacilli bacterium]
MELTEVTGIGSKSIITLNKLGIFSIEDLVTYYPFRYNILKRSNLLEVMKDDNVVIDGVIDSKPSIFFFAKHKDKMTFKLKTNNMLLSIIIYNRGYLKNRLLIGKIITIIGKYDKLHNTIVANDIKLSPLTDIPEIEPIYHVNYSITSNKIHNYIVKALKKDFLIIDYIPDKYIQKYDFIIKEEAVRIIHNPTNNCLLKKALERLKYEELFLFMIKINYLKLNNNFQFGLKRDVNKLDVDNFINNLSFTLTEDQIKCVQDVYNDLISEKRMNRLIQGDVGSGKTIVAIIAIYINYLSGYQSALMAPTEILAKQHFENISNLFSRYGIRVSLLTGNLKLKEKRQIYEKLSSGEINVIVGTHALFTDEVKYYNLGLVITDEQHRFGVNQRANLKNKGLVPDILYMSATPIPRTYALTIYGDMDVSSIKTMPNGRKPVVTYLKKDSEIKDVLNMMLEQLKSNHQIYVIAPLIEESDKIDLENINELYQKMDRAFGKFYNVDILHGKMTALEKENVMNKFLNNEIQILVSTTVIEVGVDVKNATMMVIFDSYRFGLSAIHQLRGRVGRNDLQSYCILISNKNTERLKILTETNDGFKISEEDFKLRGSGDLFGVKQSGDMNFQIANIKNDYNLLLMAKDDSDEYLKNIDLYNDVKANQLKDILYCSNALD